MYRDLFAAPEPNPKGIIKLRRQLRTLRDEGDAMAAALMKGASRMSVAGDSRLIPSIFPLRLEPVPVVEKMKLPSKEKVLVARMIVRGLRANYSVALFEPANVDTKVLCNLLEDAAAAIEETVVVDLAW